MLYGIDLINTSETTEITNYNIAFNSINPFLDSTKNLFFPTEDTSMRDWEKSPRLLKKITIVILFINLAILQIFNHLTDKIAKATYHILIYIYTGGWVCCL